MSHKYLRCPVCGKLSKTGNFQIHNSGGHHRFPDIMVQEICSTGRGKIRNEWHSEKLDGVSRRELRKVFCKILSQVLTDIRDVIELEEEDVKVEMEEVWKDEKEVFEVEGENELKILEFEEVFEVSSDDGFHEEEEPLMKMMEEEELFKVF